MKVILLRDVKNIGRKYQVKEVNDGFARNGLIGKGSALPATSENLGRMKAEMDKVNKTVSDRKELLAKGLAEIRGVEIELSGKANSEGHLFAAIHAREVAAAVERKTFVKVDPNWIEPKTFKTVGKHTVNVNVDGHSASFQLVIRNIAK